MLALIAQLGVTANHYRFCRQLDAPEPSQYVGGENGDSGAGRHASQSLFSRVRHEQN